MLQGQLRWNRRSSHYTTSIYYASHRSEKGDYVLYARDLSLWVLLQIGVLIVIFNALFALQRERGAKISASRRVPGMDETQKGAKRFETVFFSVRQRTNFCSVCLSHYLKTFACGASFSYTLSLLPPVPHRLSQIRNLKIQKGECERRRFNLARTTVHCHSQCLRIVLSHLI